MGDQVAVDFVELELEAPVVDREGEVVARSWEAITTASRMGKYSFIMNCYCCLDLSIIFHFHLGFSPSICSS